MSKIDAEFLREFLAGRDIECPLCKYNLRDLAGDRCPECGDQLVLRVNTAEPRLAAPITGLIGLSAGAGLNGLLLIYGAIMKLWHPIGGEMTPFFTCTGVGFIAEGIALYSWLRFWKTIRRLPPTTSWILAIGCWVLTLVDLIYFTLSIK